MRTCWATRRWWRNAAAAGTTADGRGRNSPYTSALLAHLEQPLELGLLFPRVRAQVLASTNGQQRPHEYQSLVGEHYLSVLPTAESVTVEVAEPAAATDAPAAAQTVFWQSILNSTDPVDFEDYLKRFPDGTFARLARRRIEALADAADAQVDVAELAITRLRQMAERGDARAQTELGARYGAGRDGAARDYRTAVSWYRRAVEQGHALAQTYLGFIYSIGRGIRQDEAEAVRLYRRAAEQGEALGQNNLGIMYRDGRGVGQDYREAARWLRRAAEQDQIRALTNLGDLYRSGRGVSQNDAEAVRCSVARPSGETATARPTSPGCTPTAGGCGATTRKPSGGYRRAAEQGLASAEYAMGWVYENGRGVERDRVEAARWYSLAAAQGHEEARPDAEPSAK